MRKFLKNEKGQSFVEFALVLPIILLIVTFSMDIFCYVNSKTILSSAAVECLAEVSYKDVVEKTVEANIKKILEKNYKGQLSLEKIEIEFSEKNKLIDKKYSFYVYSSELANQNSSKFWSQFEKRLSNYKNQEVILKIKYKIKPITFLGYLFFGSEINISTNEYSKMLYAGGYQP